MADLDAVDGERSPLARLRDKHVTLAHGAGGKAMRDLIEDVFVRCFDNPLLAALEDQARLNIADLARSGEQLALTTDSYVIDPLFFPGGDIGTLAVNGTINDLAVSGARPLYLTCAVILEEGLDIDVLRRIARSMGLCAASADVQIVTGDTKVVPRGAADKIFINTTGVGAIAAGVDIAATRARPGDAVIVNGAIGNHGAAILAARKDIALDAPIASDCQPLHELVQVMLRTCPDIHCMRDATRGGVAAVLNELARSASVCVRIKEASLPLDEHVKAISEILGIDPLYMANEGKLIAVVPGDTAESVVAAMRAHPAGQHATIIGEVKASPRATVVLSTVFGGERMVDMPLGEQLPRIC
jgi:hydrogenase expression/formation protein HypE